MSFPTLLKRTKLPNTGKFCRSKNYGIAEANQQFFADKITDGLIIEAQKRYFCYPVPAQAFLKTDITNELIEYPVPPSLPFHKTR